MFCLPLSAIDSKVQLCKIQSGLSATIKISVDLPNFFAGKLVFSQSQYAFSNIYL